MKFKIWDKKNKKFVEDDVDTHYTLGMNGDIVKVNYPHNNDTLNLEYMDSMIPLMSTGLLDNNGKEIYEGDVLYDPDTEEYYEIEYDDGYFIMSELNTNTKADIDDRLEVVSNKFEMELRDSRNLKLSSLNERLQNLHKDVYGYKKNNSDLLTTFRYNKFEEFLKELSDFISFISKLENEEK